MTERRGLFPDAPKVRRRHGVNVVVRLEMSEEFRQQKSTVFWDFFYTGTYQGCRAGRTRIRFSAFLPPLYDNCLRDPNFGPQEPVYLLSATDVWTLPDLWRVREEIYLDGFRRYRLKGL